ncbi:MAG: hypothetical protein M1365_10945, partial [Actinobacteria bacterium]|nr:hypothetical protein [Actinomycetota bacterium]
MDLLKKEEELQKGARKVLEKLDLIELLSKHGKPKIVGSVAFRLMTWKDIDIVVIVDKLNKQNIAEISAILIKKSSRRIDFTVTDNRKEDGLGKIPRGIYLGLKYFGDDIKDVSRYEAVKDIVWKIDIHFVLKDSSRSIATIEKIKSQLTEEEIG